MDYVYILSKVLFCVDVPSPRGRQYALTMTDEARATVGEKDEPMTKNIQRGEP